MIRKILTLALLAAGLIGAAAGEDLPDQIKLQKRAKQNYLLALQSEHACIRNSAIFRVMQYRAHFPQEEVQPFVKVLREMSMKDASPQNRLYAFIACTFLQNEKLQRTAGAPPKLEEDKEAYFARLQGILQSDEALVKE